MQQGPRRTRSKRLSLFQLPTSTLSTMALVSLALVTAVLTLGYLVVFRDAPNPQGESTAAPAPLPAPRETETVTVSQEPLPLTSRTPPRWTGAPAPTPSPSAPPASTSQDPSPTPSATPPPAGPARQPVTQLRLTQARNGYGPVEINMTNGGPRGGDGRAPFVGGRRFGWAFGVSPVSSLRFAVPAPYDRFEAYVGISDRGEKGPTGNRGSMQFSVFVDGALQFRSPVLKGSDAPMKISVPISGAKEIRLGAYGAGDGHKFDDALWGEPELVRNSG